MRDFHTFIRKLHDFVFHRDPLKELVKRGLVVGQNCNILNQVIIDSSHAWHITIGDDVTLAFGVQIFAHDASTKGHLNGTRIGKVVIGDRVFVGASSIILPGITIGSDVVIGAGSVVTGDIPDGKVAAGNPARVICSTDEFLQRRQKEIELYPCFGEEYTVEKNVTDDMKKEMNEKMKDRYGYLI